MGISPVDLVNAWNVNRGEMLPCNTLHVKNRLRLALDRILEVDDLPRWVRAIQRAAKSGFCTGHTYGDSEPPFVASFDWLLKPETLTLIEEGRFDNREVVPPEAGEVSRKDLSYWGQPKTRFAFTPDQIRRCQIEGRLQRKIDSQTKKSIRQLVVEGKYSWPYRYILDGARHPYAGEQDLEVAKAEMSTLLDDGKIPRNPFGFIKEKNDADQG